MENAPIADESVLAELVSLWQSRRAEGSAISAGELCQDRPELISELQRRLDALERMDQLAAVVGETLPFYGAESVSPTVPARPADHSGWPVIPGYEIQSELGRGGMGVVYQARDTHLNRLVALKMVLCGVHSSPDSLGRFRAEAEAVARLQHPHVVQVFSWGEQEGLPFLVMEYLAGGGLDRRIDGWPQPPADAARLVMLLARAVHAAHKAGVVHRDLKPANVILAPPADEPALNTAYGYPKVSDFGLARLLGGPVGLTTSFGMMGTPSYMSPEQAAGKAREVGPSADIYALGAILYELLTGQPPFKGETLLETLEQVRTLPPRPPRELCPEVPPEMEALCLHCLAKLPQDRPSTAADLAEGLRRLLERHPAPLVPSTPVVSPRSADIPPIPPEAPAATGWPKRFSRQHGIAAVAVLLTGAVGLAAFLSWHLGALPRATSEGQPEADAVVAKRLEILRLDVRHFPTVRGRREMARVGLLGKDSFSTLLDDSVTVDARLSQPAYAFLVAFRPDGTQEVCFPEEEDERPPLTDQPRYPSVSQGFNYGLEEGSGLQVFALVVSNQPLPSFKDWWAKSPGCPWQQHEAPPDIVWRSDGVDDVQALTEAHENVVRAKRREVPGKTPVAQLAQWLRKAPQVEAVEVLGFAVMPREKR